MQKSIAGAASEPQQTSLSTRAARNLAEVEKTRPQMAGITSRWLLKMLPWVDVSGGVYRVNRRLRYTLGDGVINFTRVGASVRVIPQELAELPILSGFEEVTVLESLADRFVQSEHQAGELLATEGQPADRAFLIAHGKAIKSQTGKFGDPLTLATLADGDHFGERALVQSEGTWGYSVRTTTPCTVLSIKRRAFEEVLSESEALRAHLLSLRDRLAKPQDKSGQAEILMSAGHRGEAELPQTFVDYERRPREYELSVAQTILHVHTRVADLFNHPFDQTKEQLRLVIEALREREEHELLNNPDFGLLHNVDPKQRLVSAGGAPTPNDMDELITRRRGTKILLAHPRAIAAFGQECNRRGIYPQTAELDGKAVQSWRGIPLLPSLHIPISDAGTTSILAMRLGVEGQGVVGLRPESLPEQIEPGLNVRFMGINERAVVRYLVSAYHSIAALIPDAFGVLENVEIGR